MITNEPSTQDTALPTESEGLPEQRPNEAIAQSINEPLSEARTESMPAPASIPVERTPAGPWLGLLVAFLVWVGSVILLVFVPVIVALPYLIYRIMSTGMPRPEVLANDKTLIFLSILGIVPTHLLTLVLIWLVVTQWRRKPFWKSIGFEWPKSITPGWGTAFCFALAVVLLLIGWGVTYLWGGSKTQLDLLIESSMATRFATAFVAVATAPLVEELIYRGVLYSAIERALGTGVAIAAVSLLFAGVHVFQYANNIGVITVITLLSVTLTLARAYTGKVLPSFVIHLVFNGIQSLIIVLSPLVGSSGSS